MFPLLVKFAADGLLLVVLALAAVCIIWSQRSRLWVNLPVIIMAGLTSLLAGKVMSFLYQPEFTRPFLQHGLQPGAAYIDNPGFPSDHALLATVAVVAVYMLTRNKILGIGLMALVVVMCVGRVIALVHTPLDVIGGIAAGLIGVFWYRKLTK
jgi:membrane-associated phospholipid phosphatase